MNLVVAKHTVDSQWLSDRAIAAFNAMIFWLET